MKLDRLTRWLSPPSFEDEEVSRKARLLNAYILMILLSLPIVAITALFELEPWKEAEATLAVTALSLLGLRRLLHRGLIRLVGWLIVLVGVAIITVTLISRGSILASGTGGYFLIVVMAGLLLGRRGMLTALMLSASSVIAVFTLERAKLITHFSPDAVIGDVVTVVMLTAIAGFNVSWALQIITRSVKQLRDEVAVRQRAEETLRREVEEREKVEEQLRQSQKMEAIGRLAGGVAHDFNNLLTAIMGHAELAYSSPNLDDTTRLDIAEIKKAAEQAASVSHQLLTFSRKQVLQEQVLDINEVVHEMRNLLQRLIGEDIVLNATLEAEPACILADPGQIQQIIMNLAVNARDAMPKGGRLDVSTANVRIDDSHPREIIGLSPGPYVVLSVSDNGVGMDDDVLSHLFEPFFTTKSYGEGTGLGLSTVHGVVKQCGGSITVSSELGKGTTFRIYLPRHGTTGDRLASEAAREKPTTGHETLLIVEDEESIRNVSKRILAPLGYHVLTASQASEALAIVDEHDGPIDLLITDIVMPGGLNGVELATRVRERRAATKVLYISGYTDDAIAKHGLEGGVIHLLNKPFSSESLKRKVRDILDSDTASELRPAASHDGPPV